MDSIELQVSGMTCGGCVRSVERVLSSVPGVSKVVVSLEKNSASVVYDAAQVGRETLVKAIVDAGFGAV